MRLGVARRWQGFSAIWRITRHAMRTPWQMGFALVSTLIAASLQLLIPRLLGRAIDLTQHID